jgi:hypothetical protein
VVPEIVEEVERAEEAEMASHRQEGLTLYSEERTVTRALDQKA